jgi:hypothetical protein
MSKYFYVTHWQRNEKYGRNPIWILKTLEEICEMIWKIWKKIVKWYGIYRRKASWIVKRYEKYGRKVGWIVKWYGKNGRKYWKDMEIMKEK